MSALQDRLMLACSRLKLTCTCPFSLNVDGATIEATAHVKEVGGQAGMIIVTDYDDIETVVDQLASLGYGWSVMDDGEGEEAEEEIVETYKEVFSDWGWNYDYGDAPDWYRA